MTATPQAVNATRVRRHVFRVLVVDDCESDLELTVRQLGRAWPFERELSVVSATSGDHALQVIRSTRLTFIVLDWNLPGMGGHEVLQVIRQEQLRIPVVVLSGHPREHIAVDIERLGAAYLHKQQLTPLGLQRAVASSLQFTLALGAAGAGQSSRRDGGHYTGG